MNTPITASTPTIPSVQTDEEAYRIVETYLWHCVLSMMVPLWTPVPNTAPTTAFNFDEAFKTMRALQGRPSRAEADNARSLVEIQAQRMAVEDQRAKKRLAATETVRQKRELQARKEVEDIGDFSL